MGRTLCVGRASPTSSANRCKQFENVSWRCSTCRLRVLGYGMSCKWGKSEIRIIEEAVLTPVQVIFCRQYWSIWGISVHWTGNRYIEPFNTKYSSLSIRCDGNYLRCRVIEVGDIWLSIPLLHSIIKRDGFNKIFSFSLKLYYTLKIPIMILIWAHTSTMCSIYFLLLTFSINTIFGKWFFFEKLIYFTRKSTDSYTIIRQNRSLTKKNVLSFPVWLISSNCIFYLYSANLILCSPK